MYVYGKEDSPIPGNYSSINNPGSKETPLRFATNLVSGDQITLEYYEPKEQVGQGIISISHIVYGYKHLRNLIYGEEVQKDDGIAGSSGNCQVDINCSEGNEWQREKRGVVRLIINGNGLCTGALINNTSNDGDPLLLTADHCLDGGGYDAISSAAMTDLILWWDYEDTGCKTGNINPPWTSGGATVVANNPDTDFALLRLTSNPLSGPDPIDPYFCGWDRSNSQSVGGVGIHHPAGDLKKIITVDSGPITANTVYNKTNANNFWHITPKSTSNGQSVLEGGSSGSPLFNSHHQIIGQQYSSSSADCSNPSLEFGDYGKIWASWDIDPSEPRRRLKDWLDPGNTGVTSLDGLAVCAYQATNTVTTDVVSGNTAYFEAQNSLVVSNTVNGGATAFYSSGETITFSTGFHAMPGSQIFTTIYENCSPISKAVHFDFPLAGDILTAGNSYNVQWITSDKLVNTNVKIELYDGTAWSTLVSSTPNDGVENVKIPYPNTTFVTDGKIRITLIEDSNVTGTVESVYIDVPDRITITNPTSTSDWPAGSTQNVTWTSLEIPSTDHVKIEIYNGTVLSTLINSTLNDGSQNITVPSVTSTVNDATVKLTWIEGSDFFNVSSNFTISLPASIAISNPTSSTSWSAGSTQTVQWSSSGIPASDNLKIEFYNGTSWSTLVSSTPNDGSQGITVPSIPLTISNAKIRLTHVNSGSSKESSNFSVTVDKTLTITSPQSSTVWSAGSNQNITWTSQGMTSSEAIKIEYDNGVSWSTVTSSTTNDGSHLFTPTLSQPTNNAQQIKITLNSNTSVTHSTTFTVTDFCSGSGTLSPSYSVKTITDGSGASNYQNNMNCSWTVPKPTNSSHYLVIDVDIDGFEYTNGENCFTENDYLVLDAGIYQQCFGGLSTDPNNPSDQFVRNFQGVNVTIQWHSNGSVVGSGWLIKYYYSATPGSNGRIGSTEVTTESEIKLIDSQAESKIYPNPVSSTLKVELDNENGGYMRIFDLSRKEIMKVILKNAISEVDVSGL